MTRWDEDPDVLGDIEDAREKARNYKGFISDAELKRMANNVMGEGLRLEPTPIKELKIPVDDEVRARIYDLFINEPMSYNDEWTDFLKGMYHDLFSLEIAQMFMAYYVQTGPWAEMLDNHMPSILEQFMDVKFYRPAQRVIIKRPPRFKSALAGMGSKTFNFIIDEIDTERRSSTDGDDKAEFPPVTRGD